MTAILRTRNDRTVAFADRSVFTLLQNLISALPVSRARHHWLRYALGGLAIASSAMSSGCAPFVRQSTPSYMTVQADPRHDTEAARRHHRQAMRTINKAMHHGIREVDLTRTEQHLQDALVADVRFGPAHNALGIVYYRRNQLYLAAWEFEYAAKLMPDRYEPFNNLGMVYEAAGKFEEAASYYSQAREMAPTEPEVVSNLARALVRSDRPIEEIRPVLDEIMALDRRPEWRSWAMDKLGLHPEAGATSETEPPAPSPESIPIPDNPFRNDSPQVRGPAFGAAK